LGKSVVYFEFVLRFIYKMFQFFFRVVKYEPRRVTLADEKVTFIQENISIDKRIQALR
jgi:hypothetical protein